MNAAIWAAVLPIVLLIVRHVVQDIAEQRRIERDRNNTE